MGEAVGSAEDGPGVLLALNYKAPSGAHKSVGEDLIQYSMRRESAVAA